MGDGDWGWETFKRLRTQEYLRLMAVQQILRDGGPVLADAMLDEMITFLVSQRVDMEHIG